MRLTAASKRLVKRLSVRPGGRRLLKACRIAAHPLDYLFRRRQARLLRTESPSLAIDPRSGFRFVEPDEWDGLGEILELCREIHATKKPDLPEIWSDCRPKERLLTDLLTDRDLEEHPQLVEFCLGEPIVRPVVSYLGELPNLRRLGLLLSTSGEDAALDQSQLFHSDPEDFQQVKLFLNVLDVDTPDGPLAFLPAEVSERALEKIWRESERRYRRFSDVEVFEHVAETELLTLTGPPGRAVLLDTSRCLHFGSRLDPGRERLILYAQFVCRHPIKPTTRNHFDTARYADDPLRRRMLS